jgi:cytochrome c oxidase subunit II
MKMKLIPLAVLFVGIAGWLGAVRNGSAEPPKTVQIVAKRFEFQPNKVTLKKGQTVTLRVQSDDVSHGLFVRPFKIDADIPAGETKEFTITPQQAGTFTAICDHFCGSGHGNMKMVFEVVE